MHEYSIVQALLDRVESEARTRDAVKVHSVSVRVGSLSGVEVDLLRSAYELFREGTVCAGASLEVTTVEARWACPGCDSVIPVGAALRCPACGLPARLVEGGEIMLERLEMEVP